MCVCVCVCASHGPRHGRLVNLNDNDFTGDLPAFPAAATVNATLNCLANCSYARQASCANCTWQTAVNDTAALVALYNATQGPSWVTNAGWVDYATSDPVRDWRCMLL